MRQCKSALSRSSFAPRWAIPFLALGLFACAEIAGLEEPRDLPIAAPTRSTPPARPTEPTDGLDGNEQKNTDDGNAANDIDVVPSTLDFKSALCNEDSETVTLTIGNKAKTARRFEVVLPETVFRALDPVLFDIAPNANAKVRLVAKPTFAGQAKANVVVATGATFATIPVGVVGAGGALEWSSATADVGETRTNTEGTTRVKLRNTGSRAAEITGFLGENVDFKASPKPLTIESNSEADVDLKLVPSGTASNGLLQTSIKPVAKGLCTAAPPIAVTGKRVSTDVVLTPATWGKRDCYTTPTDTKSIVIKNYYNKEISWKVTQVQTAVGQPGFVLAGVSEGKVSAANGATPGSGNIEFKSPVLEKPVGLIEQTVTVNITGDGLPLASAGDRSVKLSVDVRGAWVELTPVPQDITFVASVGSSQKKSYEIKNTGNEPAWVSWAFKRTNGPAAWTDLPQETYTNAAATTKEYVGYQPTGNPPAGTSNTATLTPSPIGSKKICNHTTDTPLPIVKLSGNKP